MNTAMTSTITSCAFLLCLAASAAGQTQSIRTSSSDFRSYGNTDAGVQVFAAAAVRASKTTTLASGSGSWFSSLSRQEQLSAGGSGRVYANLLFLGSVKRAGEFRMNLATDTTLRQTSYGMTPSSCSSYGNVYLKLGDWVVWDSSFTTSFAGRADLRMRVMVPVLPAPLGGGVVHLSGNAYGHVRAAMNGSFDPCAGRVRLDGEAAVSGDGSADVMFFSVVFGAKVSSSFYAQEQKVTANNLTAQPDIGMPYTWGRTGSLVRHSGAMRGYVRLTAILPPYIPVSSTLADWTRASTIMRIL